ncbi:hypothetical protein FOL47_005911, partial [Perkinsus chesapeaki]
SSSTPTARSEETAAVTKRDACTQTSVMTDQSVQTMTTSSSTPVVSVDKVARPVRSNCGVPPPDFSVGMESSSSRLPSFNSDDVRSHLGFSDEDGDRSPSLAQRKAFADAGAPICLLQPPQPYDYYDDPNVGDHTGYEQWPPEEQEVYDDFEGDDIGGNLDDYAVPLLPGPEEPDV